MKIEPTCGWDCGWQIDRRRCRKPWHCFAEQNDREQHNAHVDDYNFATQRHMENDDDDN